MLIVCPACASEYVIDAERLGTTGRSVRCASCRETWFVTAAAEDDAGAATVAEEPEFEARAEAEPDPGFAATTNLPAPIDPHRGSLAEEGEIVDQPVPPRRPAPAKPKARPRRRLSPALVAGLVVFVVLPLALLGRASVVRAMPQTASVFSAIGLPVNLRGIDLRDIAAFQNPAEGDKPSQLVVEGDLVGAARERIEVPPLELVIRDANGQPIYRWSVPAPRPTLEPGERARFRASLSAPPAGSRDVEVRFTTAQAALAKPDAHPETAEKPSDHAH